MKGWHSHTVYCAEHWVLLVTAPISGIYVYIFFYPESFLVFFVMSNNNRTKIWIPFCPSFLPGLFQNTPALSPCIHSNPGDWMSSLLALFFPLVLAPMSQWLSVLPVHFKYLVLFKDTIWAGLRGIFLQLPILSVVLLSDVSVIPWSTLV